MCFPVTVIGKEDTVKKKALERGVRKEQILNWFRVRLQHDNREVATSYEVARGLGLSASQKLRDWLNEMVHEGLLECTDIHKSGRMPGRGYSLSQHAGERFTRSISIKSKGKKLDQLEMF